MLTPISTNLAFRSSDIDLIANVTAAAAIQRLAAVTDSCITDVIGCGCSGIIASLAKLTAKH
jgi:hypothetical protein